MSYISAAVPSRPAPSPFMLSDSLITFAQNTDRAGLRPVAIRLFDLAYEVLDQTTAEFA